MALINGFGRNSKIVGCALILIALGANLPGPWGGPEDGLKGALAAFAAHGVRVRSVSPFYRTAPVTPYPQPDFINAVAEIETELSPDALLAALHQIEAAFGRVRAQRWSERTLDLDIIDFDGQIRVSDAENTLELPHPRAHLRGFVLAPLMDVVPDWRHPVSCLSVEALFAGLPQIERDGLHRLG
ncbi:MAG: 2-amino-4-hydroxy-6-hydroxymethyldihydropteridine diphosphokinase [Parvibaculum sp.]